MKEQADMVRERGREEKNKTKQNSKRLVSTMWYCLPFETRTGVWSSSDTMMINYESLRLTFNVTFFKKEEEDI